MGKHKWKWGDIVRIAICDDEREEIALLKKEISDLFTDDNIPDIDVFMSGKELLENVSEKECGYDLIFFDVLMPEMTGIESAGHLHSFCPDTNFVFVTNSRNYAVEAFELRALNYIIKPITAEQIKETFDRYDSRLLKPYIEVKSRQGLVKVNLESVLFVESSHNHTVITTAGGQLRINAPLREIETKLDERFVGLSRGMIVNMQFISEMKKDSCVLEDGRTVLLSRTKRNDIRSQYHNFVFNQVKNLPEWRG